MTVIVDFAMRYGNPSVAESRLEALKAKGCERILLFPLYPQYSAPTTATVERQGLRRAEGHALAAGDPHRAALFRHRCLCRLPWRQASNEGVAGLDFEPDLVITSYHGMPLILSAQRATPIIASA